MRRGAVVGLGQIAVRGHAPVWQRRRDVEIVAVTDARPAAREGMEAHFPGAHWFDGVEELLDGPPLDFVDVCTPPSSHAPIVGAALRRGLHVLCEKPLVHGLDDLAGLQALSASSGGVLHTVHNWHHAPIVRRTAELVRRGEIGQPTGVAWQTLRTQPALTSGGEGVNWRVDRAVAGGGVLSDHGWHVFYVISRWVDEVPRAVSARLERRRHRDLAVEDTATVRLAFERATADILLTWAGDERRNWAEVRGTAGTIELRDDTLVLRRDGAEQCWPCPPGLSGGGYHPEWFEGVVDRFLAEVDGDAPRGANLEEASCCVRLEHAARASSEAGGQEVLVAGAPR